MIKEEVVKIRKEEREEALKEMKDTMRGYPGIISPIQIHARIICHLYPLQNLTSICYGRLIGSSV